MREKDLVHFLNDHNGWGLTRPKSGAWNSIEVFYMRGRVSKLGPFVFWNFLRHTAGCWIRNGASCLQIPLWVKPGEEISTYMFPVYFVLLAPWRMIDIIACYFWPLGYRFLVFKVISVWRKHERIYAYLPDMHKWAIVPPTEEFLSSGLEFYGPEA